MARPAWEGNLRLSLVMCPVALYNAASSTSDVHFHLLHKDTHNRVRMIPHDPELGEVERRDLVRGYEFERNNYVILSDDEIKSVRLPSSSTIEIEKFVHEDDIDRIYWDNPYYLVPSEKTGLDAYCVIRDAMAQTRRVALGRVVMHTRERLVAIEPRDEGMLVTTLRTRGEVRAEGEFYSHIPKAKSDAKMVQIAEQIIDQLEGEFDPREFNDRYEDALRELVTAKQKGRKIVAPPPQEPAKVIDLMAALKRSVGASKGKGPERPKARSAPRKAGHGHAGRSRRSA